MHRSTLYMLLVVAASARLLLQIAAMPPYAGLDEGYHAARLAFVRLEHRNPTIIERSIPPYIAISMSGSGPTPAFSEVRERWPAVAEAHHHDVAVDQPFTASDLRPYLSRNYEAQQPSLYYSTAAPMGGGSPLRELRMWRLTAALLALLIVIATATIAVRWFGTAGIIAAAMVVAMPTWLTLVLRAGNDALACALVAAAVAITASGPRRVAAVAAEALIWGGAVATKLYVWPIAIVFPLFWRMQRGSRSRFAAVTLAGVAAAALTMHDLATRTHNPLGHFGFDPVRRTAAAVPIAWAQMIRITIASFVWTSGQHADALKPAAMLLYLGPVAIAVAAAIALKLRGNASDSAATRNAMVVATTAIATFAIAQLAGAAGFVHQARAAGLALPVGGKEGWYWYALAPIFAASLLAPALTRWRAVALWIVAWDVLITECTLFHDWGGTSSPAHPSTLFRWGPMHAPFTANLDGIGVGPLTSHLVALRLVHLGALAALFALESILQARQMNDRNHAATA